MARLYLSIAAAVLCLAGMSPAKAQQGFAVSVPTVSGVAPVPTTATIPRLVGPCDVVASAGQSCAAAHSMTRRLYGAYTGALFQLQRVSDAANLDIGTTSYGLVDLASVNAFCAGTDCLVMTLYDQSGNGNHLWAGAAEPVPVAANASGWQINRQLFLPMLQTGFWLASNNIYRNRKHTSNLPVGQASSMTYYARPTDVFGRFGDYGRAENPIATTCSGPNSPTCPAGSMFALSYANGAGPTGPAYGTAQTAFIGVDIEYYMMIYTKVAYPPQMTMLGKTDGTNLVVKYGDATTGILNTFLNARSPQAPMRVQNGLLFSEGGDATAGGMQFYEGAIVNGTTSDATDDALQTNVVAFYGHAYPTPAAPNEDLYASGGANNNGAVQASKGFGGMYGLRRMRAGYTGSAATVTRDSDGAAINVGFDTTGNFDDVTGQAFCAGTTCHALLWNQATTFQNPTTNKSIYIMSNTVANQPTLAFNALNDKTVLNFSGAQWECTPAGTGNSLAPTWFIAAVAKRTGNLGAAQTIVGQNSGAPTYALGFSAVASTTSLTTNTAQTMDGAALTDASWGLIVGQNLNGTGSVTVNNGTAVTAALTSANITGQFCIGQNSAGTRLTGQIAELVIGAASGGMAAPTAAQLTAYYNDAHAYYGGAF